MGSQKAHRDPVSNVWPKRQCTTNEQTNERHTYEAYPKISMEFFLQFFLEACVCVCAFGFTTFFSLSFTHRSIHRDEKRKIISWRIFFSSMWNDGMRIVLYKTKCNYILFYIFLFSSIRFRFYRETHSFYCSPKYNGKRMICSRSYSIASTMKKNRK